MWYVIPKDELYHHGILGQKWGVRRYQNPDGTLTAEGRKRYGVNLVKSKSNYDVARQNYKVIRKTGERSQIRKAALEKRYAKEDLQNDKILEKINNRKSISKHEQNLIEKYKAKGMSDKEAAVAAYQRVKTEKIIAAVGGVAVASLAAYGAYKYYDANVDKIIKAGTQMKRVSVGNFQGVHDAFYASRGNKDPEKYTSMYANQLLRVRAHIDKTPTGLYYNKGIFQKNIVVKDAIKVASDKSGRKILNKFYFSDANNKKIVTDVIDYFKKNVNSASQPELAKVVKNADASLRKGIIDKNVYDVFNTGLGVMNQPASDRFYKVLRDAGYDAIMDVNDRKFSGYNAKTAAIFINKGKVFVDSVKELDQSKIPSAAKEVYDKLQESANMKALWKQRAVVVGRSLGLVIGSGAATKVVTNKVKDKIVSDYRKEHPNTELSYNEIIRNYERGLIKK